MQNFRGFKDVTIDFPSNLAVFIGVNGSGKSSIIDCCALFLSLLATSVRKSEGLQFSENDIASGYTETCNQIFVVLDSKSLYLPFTFTRISTNDISLLVHSDKRSSEQLLNRIFNKDNLEPNSSDIIKAATEEFNQVIYDKLHNNSYANLPILVYYPPDRAVYEIPLESDKNHQNNQLIAYEEAVSKKVDFADFFVWYRNQEDLENEIRLGDSSTYADPKLKAIREAITLVLPKLSNLRVKRNAPLRMTMIKDDTELMINQLSSGEKNLLVIVADIARRLAIANPDPTKNALEGEGIILIDEIELHLHPQWQRDIIPRLTSTFPNCQFIVTTHSPQVLSNVKKENVFIVEDFQVYPADAYTFGRDSNSILSELMGVSERPVEIQNKLTECLYKIDDGQIEEAKVLLHELSDLLGHNDSEIVKANTLISFLSKVK
jgi:predicted ATP-binding protein involved in virulence